VDYSEQVPPERLRPFAKQAWTLACDGPPGAWIPQTATPDGCIEIICRLRGRSRWEKEQPQAFVAGLNTRPVHFEVSADAAFVALRVWPWAWNAIARVRSPDLLDRWLPLELAAPGLRFTADPWEIVPPDEAVLAGEAAAIGASILLSNSVGDLVARTGRPYRWLQRWFEREVGVPPRTYLRLLRFQETLTAMQHDPSPLADHAAAQGYADQAHMTREFRRLAGLPARRARRKASGPFL